LRLQIGLSVTHPPLTIIPVRSLRLRPSRPPSRCCCHSLLPPSLFPTPLLLRPPTAIWSSESYTYPRPRSSAVLKPLSLLPIGGGCCCCCRRRRQPVSTAAPTAAATKTFLSRFPSLPRSSLISIYLLRFLLFLLLLFPSSLEKTLLPILRLLRRWPRWPLRAASLLFAACYQTDVATRSSGCS
jgi:hypothetical protein